MLDLYFHNSDTTFLQQNCLVLDVTLDSPSTTTNKNNLANRNGNIYTDTIFTNSTIDVTGKLIVDNDIELIKMRNKLNSLFLLYEPEDVTIVAFDAGFADYQFQSPGDTTDQVVMFNDNRFYKSLLSKYTSASTQAKSDGIKYKLVTNSPSSFTFDKKLANKKRIYNFKYSYTTAYSPFARDSYNSEMGYFIDRDNQSFKNLFYKGSYPNKQFDNNWSLSIELSQSAPEITISIKDKVLFRYNETLKSLINQEYKTKSGDTMIITAARVIVRESNGTEHDVTRNCEYFETLYIDSKNPWTWTGARGKVYSDSIENLYM